MVVCQEILQIRKLLSQKSFKKKSVGFVPTMGALHKGHLKLLQEARKQNGLLVSSIFVNPMQFNDSEDFQNYPRDTETDLAMMDKAGCDVVFMPQTKELYASKPEIKILFGSYASGMEGAFRPDHFSGVGLVICKLFNIIRPNVAYFGQKDLQQAAIITRLVKDLHFDLEVNVVDTIREKDGLACSSRNRRLNESQRKKANSFYKALKMAQDLLLANHSIKYVTDEVCSFIDARSGVELEYFEVVNSNTLETLTAIGQAESVSLCIAGYIGEVRLIDNIYYTHNQRS